MMRIQVHVHAKLRTCHPCSLPTNHGTSLPCLYAKAISRHNPGMTPELIVHAGRIVGGRSSAVRMATSVAVLDGRIAAVGLRGQIGRLRGRNTEVLSLPHAALMPAFIDAHTHFFDWACRPDMIELADATSAAEVLRRIGRAAKARKPGEWVVARGFDKNHWAAGTTRLAEQPSFPSAGDLDAVTGAVPTQVSSRDGHTMWVNTAALRLAGITAATKAPAGGSIHRDAVGNPTGILQENAIGLLPAVESVLTDGQIERALLRGIRRAHRYGITCVHSVDGVDGLRWFQRLRAAGTLSLRIRYAIPADRIDHAIALGLQGGLGDDLLRICGVKVFADGSLGSQSALMVEPYPARPRYRGVAVCVGAGLRRLACKAARAGLPCWIHAIGDRANHEVLNALAEARRLERQRLLHRIEHAQCVRPADARRMGRLGIIASMQPCHIVGDIDTAERHWSNVLPWTYPIRALERAGVTLAFGSDIPVETFDPIVGLHAAVNRQTLDLRPSDGWQMHQAIGVRNALRAYTAGAAAAAGDADRLGGVAPGMFADLVVLSGDPTRIPRQRLLDLRVLATICDGKVVHRSDHG